MGIYILFSKHAKGTIRCQTLKQHVSSACYFYPWVLSLGGVHPTPQSYRSLSDQLQGPRLVPHVQLCRPAFRLHARV